MIENENWTRNMVGWVHARARTQVALSRPLNDDGSWEKF